MSANTLTGLIPTIMAAFNIIAQEDVGFIPAVSREMTMERVAVGQTVRSPIVPALAAEDATPSNVPPNTTGFTVDYVDLSITKTRVVPFNWTGDEQLSLGQAVGISPLAIIQRDAVAQAIRTLRNEIETDLAALARQACRAYGTAGTAPFGTAGDLTDLAQIKKILQDNGAPQSDLRMVLNTTHSASLRGKQSSLFKVNEAGTDAMLRRGSIGRLMDFEIGESAKLSTFTKGTGASATTDDAGYAIGATTITLASAGTGTILAGDIITFAGDTNKYVVETGDADVSGGGTIVLRGTGLRQAIPAAATAITVGNNYTPSVGFHRGAFHLGARLPALPQGGDGAHDRVVITDPYSLLSFEFATYRQYRQVRHEVGIAWGVKTVKEENAAILLG